jgi:pyrimidine-nucleoside phosphorylase
MIDPLSWALGFAVDKAASWAVEKRVSPGLSGRLTKAVREWGATVPNELSLEPGTLFTNTTGEGPQRTRLRETLDDERVPSLATWQEALVEEWRRIAARSAGEALQPFYHAPENVVLPHLTRLAERLHRICQQDEGLSRRTTNLYLERLALEKLLPVDQLRAILNKLGYRDVPDDRIVALLEEKADEYLRLLERASLAPDDGTLALLKAGDVNAVRGTLRAGDVIRVKRNGGALSREAIAHFIDGVTSGEWPDYQTAALLMAMALRGMSSNETAWLTDALARSGERIDLSAIPGTHVTLHGTGAVGDKLSIVVPPIVAACGVVVPKLAGRGLGHLAGTLDKLEAIPGFRVTLTRDEYLAVLGNVGCAIAGQSRDLAPADRRLHALRDVTGTVESVPLIVASILCKVIAAGNDRFVMHVRYGSGATFEQRSIADALAAEVETVTRSLGLHATTVLTPVQGPVGRAVGHALEIAECAQLLAGHGPGDLRRSAIDVAATMLRVGGRASADHEATRLAEDALLTGAALATFRRMIEGHGGDVRVIDDPSRLPAAPHRTVVTSPAAGYISAIGAQRIGQAAVYLGAGRQHIHDAVDHGVGLVLQRQRGDAVRVGDPLAELHYRDDRFVQESIEAARAAFIIEATRPQTA